jgi:septal ring factor EnvC (AmiA/AmiB activator)
LEQSARELEDLLARLDDADRERGGAPSTEFISRQGSMPWPVQGRVTRGFGRSVHPRFNTVVINKGINIEAPAGTPIRAVAPGTVDYVNWLPGYGKCIILNHGDGWYSLYAHAAEIFPGVGARVDEGQVIAEVGDTGSLDGSQLYFEIRQGKEPVDPARWLKPSRGR